MAASGVKEKLIKRLDSLKEVKETLVHAVGDIQTTESEVEAQGRGVVESVNEAFDELERIIRNRRQEILKEVTVKVSEKLENLSAQRKGVSMSYAVVQSVIDYTEQCVEHSADDEVMSMHTEIHTRIDREIEEQYRKNLEPVEEADMGEEVRLCSVPEGALQDQSQCFNIFVPRPFTLCLHF